MEFDEKELRREIAFAIRNIHGTIIIPCLSFIGQLIWNFVKRTSCYIFDVFQGGNLPLNKKSIAINVSLQADDKTLSDNDLNQISEKIIILALL